MSNVLLDLALGLVFAALIVAVLLILIRIRYAFWPEKTVVLQPFGYLNSGKNDADLAEGFRQLVLSDLARLAADGPPSEAQRSSTRTPRSEQSGGAREQKSVRQGNGNLGHVEPLNEKGEADGAPPGIWRRQDVGAFILDVDSLPPLSTGGELPQFADMTATELQIEVEVPGMKVSGLSSPFRNWKHGPLIKARVVESNGAFTLDSEVHKSSGYERWSFPLKSSREDSSLALACRIFRETGAKNDHEIQGMAESEFFHYVRACRRYEAYTLGLKSGIGQQADRDLRALQESVSVLVEKYETAIPERVYLEAAIAAAEKDITAAEKLLRNCRTAAVARGNRKPLVYWIDTVLANTGSQKASASADRRIRITPGDSLRLAATYGAVGWFMRRKGTDQTYILTASPLLGARFEDNRLFSGDYPVAVIDREVPSIKVADEDFAGLVLVPEGSHVMLNPQRTVMHIGGAGPGDVEILTPHGGMPYEFQEMDPAHDLEGGFLGHLAWYTPKDRARNRFVRPGHIGSPVIAEGSLIGIVVAVRTDPDKGVLVLPTDWIVKQLDAYEFYFAEDAS